MTTRRTYRRIIHWRWEFKPQDLWVGLYLKNNRMGLHLWFTLLPMFPLHVWTEKRYRSSPARDSLSEANYRYQYHFVNGSYVEKVSRPSMIFGQ